MLTLDAVAAASVQARACIASHLLVTPFLPARNREGDLWFKDEQFQRTGSFKLRGALNKLTALASDAVLITASSGNHGIACATAAKALGRSITVVLPEGVSPLKRRKIEALGAEILIHGTDSGLTERYARALAGDRGGTYVSPYNDADIIAGQGTLALELLDQAGPDGVSTVFVSMGGGGLISGMGAVLKSFSPKTRIVGVSAENSAALRVAIAAGRVVDIEHRDTLADGVAGGMDEGALTLPIASAVIDEIVSCSETEIIAAFRTLALEEGRIVEGAAAHALAGYQKVSKELAPGCHAVVLCGGNIAPEKVRQLIAEGP